MAYGSALPEQTGDLAPDDLLIGYVDTSDPSAAPTGTNKHLTVAKAAELASPFPYGFPSYGKLAEIQNIRHYGAQTSGGDGFVVGTPSGTGGTTIAGITQDGDVAGLELSTGATSDGAYAYGCSSNQLAGGFGRYRLRQDIRIPVVSDGTETFEVVSGLSDSFTGNIVDGVYFLHDKDVNGGRWSAVCTVADVETVVDTGVDIDTVNYQSLEIEFSEAGVATFYINGTLVATISTNVPTGLVRLFGYMPIRLLKSAGTTARTASIRRHYFHYKPTVPV
jgi:hypothetical protein